MWEKWKSIDNRYRIMFAGSLGFGVLAHGMMLFTKYSFHDDLSGLFGYGGEIGLGRWMLWILWNLMQTLVRGRNASIPTLNGFVTILLSACIGCILIRLFRIRSRCICLVLSGIMVTFPVMTGLMGYMYYAPYYMAGALMVTAGAAMIAGAVGYRNTGRNGSDGAAPKSQKHSVLLRLAAGTLLMICGTGVYQAYITVGVSVLFLDLLIRTMDAGTGEPDRTGKPDGSPESETTRKPAANRAFLMRLCLYLLTLLVAVIGYWIINTIFVSVSGASLEGRVTADSVLTGPIGYLKRIVLCYRDFFIPNVGNSYTMYPMTMHSFYVILLILVLIGLNFRLNRLFHVNRGATVRSVILLLLAPFALNAIFFLLTTEDLRSLTMYSSVIQFAGYAVLADRLLFELPGFEGTKEFFSTREPRKVLTALLCLAMSWVILLSTRYANLCYMKAEMMQASANTYFATLITQIKSQDGYRENLPVIFLNPMHIDDAAYRGTADMEGFEGVTTDPYHSYHGDLTNNYGFREYMGTWCGFYPEYRYDEETFLAMPEVQAMSYYPDAGSIAIIDDVVVVKFG